MKNLDSNPIEPYDIFIFCYRARYRPAEDFVKGNDLSTVKKQCIDYCNRHGITFISVRPAFLDLSKGLRNTQLMQEEAEEVVPK